MPPHRQEMVTVRGFMPPHRQFVIRAAIALRRILMIRSVWKALANFTNTNEICLRPAGIIEQAVHSDVCIERAA
jgi:hypothetical protein